MTNLFKKLQIRNTTKKAVCTAVNLVIFELSFINITNWRY